METPGINKAPFTIYLTDDWNPNLKHKHNMNVKVQVFNESKNALPQYATDFSAGVDLMMWKDGLKEFDKIIIPPHRHILIGTGLHVAIPEGYELQIRPRSGLAAKKAITVLNTPGTIDSKQN